MRKQLAVLCAANAILFCAFTALIGLMPVYLARLGADSIVTGFFLA